MDQNGSSADFSPLSVAISVTGSCLPNYLFPKRRKSHARGITGPGRRVAARENYVPLCIKALPAATIRRINAPGQEIRRAVQKDLVHQRWF